MDRKISFSTYRAIDITIFTTLMIIFEFFSVRGFDLLNGIYSLSLFLVLSQIVWEMAVPIAPAPTTPIFEYMMLYMIY